MQFVLASANVDKAAEIRQILTEAIAGIELVIRPAGIPEVVEDGETLEDNARLKAKALCEATGLAAVADDTGLEVDALGGEPGVYSARYAGQGASYADNVAKLLASLAGVKPSDRRARFRTVALAIFPDGLELVATGLVEGVIAEAACGTMGFGYDPVFVADGASGKTFAELSPSAKHALSHRGRAFRSLAVKLAANFH